MCLWDFSYFFQKNTPIENFLFLEYNLQKILVQVLNFTEEKISSWNYNNFQVCSNIFCTKKHITEFSDSNSFRVFIYLSFYKLYAFLFKIIPLNVFLDFLELSFKWSHVIFWGSLAILFFLNYLSLIIHECYTKGALIKIFPFFLRKIEYFSTWSWKKTVKIMWKFWKILEKSNNRIFDYSKRGKKFLSVCKN